MADTTSTSNYYKMRSNNLRSVVKTFLVITKSAHKLTNSLIELMTEFIYRYIQLKETVQGNESYINTLLFSTDSKRDIIKTLEIDNTRFNNMIALLRKQGVLKGNTISKSIIPNLSTDTEDYKIIFDFKIDGNENKG